MSYSPCPVCGRPLRGRLPVIVDPDDEARALDPDARVLLTTVDDSWTFIACVHACAEDFGWIEP